MKAVRNVTVLGANGTMGRNVAAIFASFGNANVFLVSRTLEKSEIAKEKAFLSVRAESIKDRMFPKDYTQLSECAAQSELIFEACAEDVTVKRSVHEMVAETIHSLPVDSAVEKIVCSGTSGLSITELAKIYEEPVRSHVIGMHFFNPPYQMTLCELTPTVYTDREFFESVMEYTKKTLLRTAVEVKDSPAFLGNRVGFQFINEAMRLAEKYKDNGGIDYVDAVFGSFTGRAMAPLVTANFVGLDVHKAIMDNLCENADDFARESFVIPQYAEHLVSEGKLGRKSGEGLYKTVLHKAGVKIHQVYDIVHSCYRETMNYTFPFSEEMISHLRVGSYDDAMKVLLRNHSAEAELCLENLLKYVLYALSAAESVVYNIHSADDVMAAGFNWCPPLAMVQALGGKEVFQKLCGDRISEKWMSRQEQARLSQMIEPSKYDYRRFIKAKR